MIPNRKTPDIFGDVKQFIDLAQPDLVSPFGLAKKETLELAKKLIHEEVNVELMRNLEDMIEHGTTFEKLAQLLDDAIDSIYVLAWTVAVLNLPGKAAWNEVQRANMSKFPAIESVDEAHWKSLVPTDSNFGHIIYHTHDLKGKLRIIIRNKETNKVVKPVGFKPPNIFEVMLAIKNLKIAMTQHDGLATPLYKEYFKELEGRIEKGEVDA